MVHSNLGQAFVIGNGPSLAHTPLERLIGETTFAMNRIHLIYPMTIWRPTYYFCLDYTGPTWADDIVANAEEAKHSFVRADRASEVELRRHGFEWPSRISYFWHCRAHLGCNWQSAHRPETWHLPEVCPYGSTLNATVQCAVLMGYGPIYLLGCDLGYPGHFHPEYGGHDDFPIEERDRTLQHMHGIMERSSPVRLYNATLGGSLEEHERIDLEEILHDGRV